MASPQAVKPLKSKLSSLSWTHTHVNPIIKTMFVLDIFRFNTAAKKYRKDEKRKGQLGFNESSSDDNDDARSASNAAKKYRKEKRRGQSSDVDRPVTKATATRTCYPLPPKAPWRRPSKKIRRLWIGLEKFTAVGLVI